MYWYICNWFIFLLFCFSIQWRLPVVLYSAIHFFKKLKLSWSLQQRLFLSQFNRVPTTWTIGKWCRIRLQLLRLQRIRTRTHSTTSTASKQQKDRHCCTPSDGDCCAKFRSWPSIKNVWFRWCIFWKHNCK